MNDGGGKLVSEILIWVVLAAWASAAASSYALGAPLPVSANLAGRFAFPIVLASWVYADADLRRRKLCYDYDTFLLFAWPIVMPCYLFQTRGIRAFLTLLYFGGMCLAALLFGAMVYGLLLVLER
jgi:hypothetical protein